MFEYLISKTHDLLQFSKWRSNDWIELQLNNHFDEIRTMIKDHVIFDGENERVGTREVVDLIIISLIYLFNNHTNDQINKLIHSRVKKFYEKVLLK